MLKVPIRSADEEKQPATASAGAAQPGPFERTVPRQYVHRAAVAEVLLTGWQDCHGSHLIHGQWPRSHAFYQRLGSHEDPLLAAETVRQAGALLAHTVFGVPVGHQFMLERLTYSLVPEELAVTGVPTPITMRVRCEDARSRQGRLASLQYTCELLREGRTLGHAEAAFRCLHPSVYQRIRRSSRDSAPPHETPAGTVPSGVEPRLVGRDRSEDVVLAPTTEPHHWHLRMDTRHPVLFDHPLDHAPGMLLMEAARQAARLVHGPEPVLPVAAAATFDRYVELDAPCRIEAEPSAGGDGDLVVRAVQGGHVCFTTTMSVWPPARDGEAAA